MKSTVEAFNILLRKTFDIRQGELLRAALMQVYIFLVIFTLLIVKPTVNGLFLSKFGVEKLPYAFMLVALVAGLVTTFYARIVRNIPLNKIINGTLVFSALSFLFFGIALRLNIWESGILFLFYIWVAIFALLATSQFWVLANIVFNAREAKRLFSFIGAGAIAGGIFGGYFTSVIVKYMSSEFLPYWGALFIGLCIPINLTIWKKFVDKKQSTFQQMKRVKGFGDHPFNLVRRSRHLTFLASIVGVSVIIAKLVDYQFGGIAAALIPDPDELTAFFGFWLSTFSVISLLLQLFITHRVVGTFGVGASLLFLPSTILLAVGALILFPGLLATAVFLKMSDAGLKQSINKASMELLIMPIPVDVKNQTKTFIDVFVDSLATGISGIILVLLVAGFNLSTNAINAMIISLLLIWFYLIAKVKDEYLISFRKKIELPHNHIEKKEIDFKKESVINGIIKVLDQGNPYQQLILLEKINGIQHKRLFESVKKLLHHPSDEVKAAAIRHLYFYTKPNILPEIELLTEHQEQAVQIAAFEYLVKHAKEDRVAVMEKYLHQEDYRVRGAALMSLAEETRDNPKLILQFKLANRLQGKLDILSTIEDPEELEFRTISALNIIGNADLPDFYAFIHTSFSHPNIKIARAAILAAGNTLNSAFIANLIKKLTAPRLKSAARSALVNYGPGIISNLKQMIRKEELTKKELSILPSVIKEIGTQEAVNLLYELESENIWTVKHEALRGLNYLRNHHEHLKFHPKKITSKVFAEIDLYEQMLAIVSAQKLKVKNQDNAKKPKIAMARNALIQLMEKRLTRTLERIFRFLGLLYSNGDIYIIYKGIRHTKPDLKTNALEFLDNLLNPKLKKRLIPLVELTMKETSGASSIKELHLKIPEDYECFQLLLDGRDTRLKIAVLYLLEQLDEERYQYMIREQMGSEDSKVSAYAKKII